MSNIELVIKISDELYEKNLCLKYGTALEKAIQNGVVLPKGHGRLIDADALVDTLGASDRDIYCESVIKEDAPTLIEADKE